MNYKLTSPDETTPEFNCISNEDCYFIIFEECYVSTTLKYYGYVVSHNPVSDILTCRLMNSNNRFEREEEIANSNTYGWCWFVTRADLDAYLEALSTDTLDEYYDRIALTI